MNVPMTKTIRDDVLQGKGAEVHADRRPYRLATAARFLVRAGRIGRRAAPPLGRESPL